MPNEPSIDRSLFQFFFTECLSILCDNCNGDGDGGGVGVGCCTASSGKRVSFSFLCFHCISIHNIVKYAGFYNLFNLFVCFSLLKLPVNAYFNFDEFIALLTCASSSAQGIVFVCKFVVFLLIFNFCCFTNAFLNSSSTCNLWHFNVNEDFYDFHWF